MRPLIAMLERSLYLQRNGLSKNKLKRESPFTFEKRAVQALPGAQDRYEQFTSAIEQFVVRSKKENPLSHGPFFMMSHQSKDMPSPRSIFCGVIAFTEVDSVGIDEYMDHSCNSATMTSGVLYRLILISPQSEDILGKRFDIS